MTAFIKSLLYADTQSGPGKMEGKTAEKAGEICNTNPQAIPFQDICQEGTL